MLSEKKQKDVENQSDDSDNSDEKNEMKKATYINLFLKQE